ncbi:hypothetical protein GCM10009855_33020 [Gordonia cholesterolivorans]|uniref:Uncharacterized protein n=1 Tax=Gordonia cholesterolivorans TaxID=559625 RepID=A0ABP5UY72_9ACTN
MAAVRRSVSEVENRVITVILLAGSARPASYGHIGPVDRRSPDAAGLTQDTRRQWRAVSHTVARPCRTRTGFRAGRLGFTVGHILEG